MEEPNYIYEEFEDRYVARAKSLTSHVVDPEAWKKLMSVTRKGFTDKNWHHCPREVLLKLAENFYSMFAPETSDDGNRLDNFDDDASKLADALEVIYPKSYKGPYPTLDTFADLTEFITPTLLDEFDLHGRVVVALRILKMKYRTIADIWNRVFSSLSEEMPDDEIPLNIGRLMIEIRESLCDLFSELEVRDWLCRLVRYRHSNKKRQTMSDLRTFYFLYEEYVRPPDVRFERSDDPSRNDNSCPRLRDIPSIGMKHIRQRLDDQINNQSSQERSDVEHEK